MHGNWEFEKEVEAPEENLGMRSRVRGWHLKKRVGKPPKSDYHVQSAAKVVTHGGLEPSTN
jgi:hypothetical protein